MAWTTPKTWNDGDVLTAAELNEQVRDNLDFLYAKPGDTHNLNEAANYTTTSSTFVDVDATDLALTMTTGGGDVLVWLTNAYITVQAVSAGIHFDLDVNGSRVGGDDGIAKGEALVSDSGHSMTGDKNYASIGFVYLVTGLAAGSNTIKLQWKYTGGNVAYPAIWYVGAGTANGDLHPQFGAREL